MPVQTYPIDPPVSGGWCRNCGDEIVALAQIFDDGMAVRGLCDYEWTHGHGSTQCRPKTSAQPYDAWQATARVQGALAARQAAEEALEKALED